MPDMKRYADWKGSLSEFLKVGDVVDEEMVDHFIGVLPPACYTSSVVQMGEPYSHHKGRQTYHTLKNTPDGWIYAGDCYMGGELPSIEVRYVYDDDWGRKVYYNTEVPGAIYKRVDDRLYTVTDDGEPLWPLKAHFVVNEVE